MDESKFKRAKKPKLNEQITINTAHLKEGRAEHNSLLLFKDEAGTGVKLNTLASLANKDQTFEIIKTETKKSYNKDKP